MAQYVIFAMIAHYWKTVEKQFLKTWNVLEISCWKTVLYS